MPVGFARERLGAYLDIASYQQGGRARLVQDGLARNKRRSGFTREAPRGRRSISQAQNVSRRTPGGARSHRRRMCRGGHLAALGLTGAECVEADTWRRSISQAQNVSRRTPGGARSHRRRMCRGGHLAALGLTGAGCVGADTWRRSISQALNSSRHARCGSTPLHGPHATSRNRPPVAPTKVPVALSSEAVAPL